MSQRTLVFLLVFLYQISVSVSVTNSQDVAALSSFKNLLQNTPFNWVGQDPCGGQWDGISCTNSRVISMTLSSIGLKGQLPGDVYSLSELQALDLSYTKGLTGTISPSIGNLKKLTNLILLGCSFSGPIPDTIGSLQQLAFLSLNSNSFSGNIPPSIGNLSKLYWLDLADNKLDGTIPVSNGSTPGLDMLIHTRHFHFGKNQLSGIIPPQLFSSNMALIHVLFDGNQLTGNIPSTLGFVKTLEVLRLDRNLLSGPLPLNLNNLTSVSELHLSNNKLSGPMPNLSSMNLLSYLDLSNNTFDASDVPSWFSNLQSLTSLEMENTGLQGQIPVSLFSISQLQTVNLRNNQLNGTLDIGTNYSNQLQLIDLEGNLISGFVEGRGYQNELLLKGNPFCKARTDQYCTVSQQFTPSYSTNTENCVPVLCNPDQKSSPTCKCLYPYTGTLFFRGLLFSDLENSSYYVSLEKSLMQSFQTYKLPVDSVSLSNPTMDNDNYLELSLEVFPSGRVNFNQSEILKIGFMLSNQTFKPPKVFYGPFFFIGVDYNRFTAEPSGKSKNSVGMGVIIGAAGGGCVLLLVLICAGLYVSRRKRRAKRATEQNYPFASWDPSKSSGSIPQLKGARWFSFDELKKCTNNFSEANDIGSGGYGKVYRGTLPTGQLVAIKRAMQGSVQSGVEFKTEIELLSRVHHKNLVSLVGFCFEQGEQMLIYEYIPNGTLRESLSGKSGIRLDWKRRLQVALGSARGLSYLHELADPPIIHRDIKSTNILLDNHLNAKVSDFGLSKLFSDNEKGHITTQVKGTMGYLDPEYYMTQQLTEKSDVFSFGVVMLELIAARMPIEQGKYIVREVRVAMDKRKDLYGLHELLDPSIGPGTNLEGFERFVDLAMRCVEDSGVDRPSMSKVVKEIESIMQLAGLNPNAESASTSESYEVTSRGNTRHPYSNEAFPEYSGEYTPYKVER